MRETDSNQVRTVKITNRWPSPATLYKTLFCTCVWKGSLRNIVIDKPAVVPTSGMSRSSPAAFPNVGAGAGISAGPDYVWKTPFDNIASGAGAGTGKAGVCESALNNWRYCQDVALTEIAITKFNCTLCKFGTSISAMYVMVTVVSTTETRYRL